MQKVLNQSFILFVKNKILMRVLISFSTICVLSSAVAIENNIDFSKKTASLAEGWSGHRFGEPNGPNNMPSPEFNKRVYNFDEDQNVFDQLEYETRI